MRRDKLNRQFRFSWHPNEVENSSVSSRYYLLMSLQSVAELSFCIVLRTTNMFAILCGSRSDIGLKDFREMALIDEACLQSDFGERRFAFHQFIARFFDSQLANKFTDGRSILLAEAGGQINRMNPDRGGNVGEPESFGKVFDDHFASLPEPGRSRSHSAAGSPRGLSHDLHRQSFNRQVCGAVGFVKFTIQPGTQAGQAVATKLRSSSQRDRMRSEPLNPARGDLKHEDAGVRAMNQVFVSLARRVKGQSRRPANNFLFSVSLGVNPLQHKTE